ncbi:uncharacterized protein METZ01_LOCUS296996, partial [marine metagenome]
MFRRQAILSLLYPLAIAFAQAAKKPEVIPPWNQWIEPDFPFFSAAVDARDKPVETNLTPRALVFPLGDDYFLAYDLDLL